ncbi:MAG TPA: phosphatidate cytidylyltransferase [Gammaproteobacteria bacterium]|nr:phosphatidate cytidylyltransferase [Gammaproteobacteria bacterium]
MLKQRLITAAILVPLVVWGILRLPTPYLALVLALFIVQGAWEWTGFMQLKVLWQRLLYVVVVTLGLACIWFFQQDAFLAGANSDWLALPLLSLFWWLLATVWVLSYPRMLRRWSSPAVLALIGLLVLLPTWLAVVGLHASGEQGPLLVMYLLSLIWVADSGAYFGGRAWGRRKLAPAVSPGKTWEGVGSAVAVSTVYAIAAALVLGLPGNLWLVFIVLSLVTVVFSVLGDLTESMFKRHAGIKDSGALLPGHGGVLDRIDSVTAAAPVFVTGLWLTGLTGTSVT